VIAIPQTIVQKLLIMTTCPVEEEDDDVFVETGLDGGEGLDDGWTVVVIKAVLVIETSSAKDMLDGEEVVGAVLSVPSSSSVSSSLLSSSSSSVSVSLSSVSSGVFVP